MQAHCYRGQCGPDMRLVVGSGDARYLGSEASLQAGSGRPDSTTHGLIANH